jgi:pimeloyl-ACP methyl ester carboxylesterase
MTTSTPTPTTATRVTSADGTKIASYVSGTGVSGIGVSGTAQTIVLVDAALSLHGESAKLAALLAPDFTVVTYDRRGRGASGDAQPDTADPSVEIDDIAALIAANGGTAVLFGSSSGAVVALNAAARLGAAVTGVVMFEPPFIVDDTRAPLAPDVAENIAAAVARGDRSRAETMFFRRAMGIPALFVLGMRLFMPSWKQGVALAHTLRYDFAALAGTQDGHSLPAERWTSLASPGLVLVGSKSEAFYHTGGRALAELLPTVTYESLEGGHHGSAVMAPEGIANVIKRFAGKA